jgi:arsenite methyltransferase
MTSFEHDSKQLAESYANQDRQFANFRPVIEKLGLVAGARVLDVGCGTGQLARLLSERVGSTGSVTGVDPLPERIELARSAVAGVRFEVGTAEDLGAFADASFDAVTMSSVLHWVADKAKALAEVRRVLRPGGRLGVTTTPIELSDEGTIGKAIRLVLRGAAYAGNVDLAPVKGLTSGTTTTDVVKLVVGSGLALVELHILERNMTYASGAELVDFLEASAFGNFSRIVAEPLRPQFRADLAAAFDAQKSPEGVIARGWTLNFVATRRI